MAETSFPYVGAYSNITKALNALIEAPTPPRFTQDFLSTKLAMPGGSARPVIPFLKKTGLLGSDGTPTDLYNEFRNSDLRGAAAAQALKQGFSGLFAYNEYLYELDDTKLRNVIVQATGLKSDATTVKAILGSFKALKEFANFEAQRGQATLQEPEKKAKTKTESDGQTKVESGVGINLGYTINLNLPASTDIEVFNAIFSSLREHILKK